MTSCRFPPPPPARPREVPDELAFDGPLPCDWRKQSVGLAQSTGRAAAFGRWVGAMPLDKKKACALGSTQGPGPGKVPCTREGGLFRERRRPKKITLWPALAPAELRVIRLRTPRFRILVFFLAFLVFLFFLGARRWDFLFFRQQNFGGTEMECAASNRMALKWEEGVRGINYS